MEVEGEELEGGGKEDTARITEDESKDSVTGNSGETKDLDDEEKEGLKFDNNKNKEPIVDSFKKPAPAGFSIGPRSRKFGETRGVVVPSEESSGGEPSGEVNVESAGRDEQHRAALDYKEPSWAGEPEAEYKLQVLKSGVILHTVDISEGSYRVVGRLPTCDVSLAHPTVSRYHAVLQYRGTSDGERAKGFYLYDLGSTHGTFWNGRRVRPRVYVKLFGGHAIRFGCSQRKFILQAPPEDTEEESPFSVTELKEKRRLELEEKKRAEETERSRLQKEEEEEGIDWGMGEDADEETDLTENPYAITNNEELFLDDPKKTLRGWFEREGHELRYQTEERGIGQFLCWLDLPLDTASGRSVRAEALVKGKKKESVIQCALEACRILDRHGVLRRATHEARKRKPRNWEEEDFYDSDEDNFLDRTGSVEKKREQRMRQAGKLEAKVETYSSLLEKRAIVAKKIADIEARLRNSEKAKDAAKNASQEDDALDAFMSNLNSTTIFNKAELTKIKLELQSLRKDDESLLKLIGMTKPASLPSLSSKATDAREASSDGDKSNWKISKRRSMDGVDGKPGIVKEKSSIREFDSEEDANAKNAEVTKSGQSPPGSIERYRAKDNDEPSVNDNAIKSRKAGVSEVARKTRSADDAEGNDIVEKKKKRNTKRAQQRAGKEAKAIETRYEDVAYRDDYSMWLPPQNQSGDGKTNLNDKYGY